MGRNFTYEVVEQRRRLKAIKKNVAQKINVVLFFHIEFFKYFFRVLHEASLVVKISAQLSKTPCISKFVKKSTYNQKFAIVTI
jgi:hypothetical protein